MKSHDAKFVFAVLLACSLMSCVSADNKAKAEAGEDVIMDHREMSFLEIAAGTYRGPNLLWFQDPNKPEESVSDVVVTNDEINYTWEFRGKPQSGRMVFHMKPNAVEVDWVDSWHAAEGFKCVGTHSQDGMKFLCHYGEEGKPQWGWRTELSMPAPDKFLVEMYNITPQGQEQIAVRISAKRTTQ